MARQKFDVKSVAGFQQGDVLLVPCEALPSGKRCPRTAKGYILAEGEATGHSHAIADEVELIEHDGTLFLRVKQSDGVILRHEEHHAQTIPPGTYRIDKVREKDMLDGFVRSVVD